MLKKHVIFVSVILTFLALSAFAQAGKDATEEKSAGRLLMEEKLGKLQVGMHAFQVEQLIGTPSYDTGFGRFKPVYIFEGWEILKIDYSFDGHLLAAFDKSGVNLLQTIHAPYDTPPHLMKQILILPTLREGAVNPMFLMTSTNSYAYALNWPGIITYGIAQGYSWPPNYKPQPGNFMFNTSQVTVDLLNAFEGEMGFYTSFAAGLDAGGNGHVFRAATEENLAGENLGSSEWIVYLVATSGWGDYHFYRQDYNADGNLAGTWSHKPGRAPVERRELLRIRCYDVAIDEETQMARVGSVSYEYDTERLIIDPTQISRSTTTYYYDINGVEIESMRETVTYDKVEGAYVVGPKPEV